MENPNDKMENLITPLYSITLNLKEKLNLKERLMGIKDYIKAGLQERIVTEYTVRELFTEIAKNLYPGSFIISEYKEAKKEGGNEMLGHLFFGSFVEGFSHIPHLFITVPVALSDLPLDVKIPLIAIPYLSLRLVESAYYARGILREKNRKQKTHST